MANPPECQFLTTTLCEDGVLIIKYNRPETGNSINNAAIKGLLRTIKWAIDDSRVRIIVQTGEGKFFSTANVQRMVDEGMDLSLPKTTRHETDDAPRVLYEINKLLIDCEKITIAAVNGPGVGYGASSLGLFDLVYVVQDAYFFTPFIKWGLCAEACSSFTFPTAMGRQKASHLIMTGERISAQDLESLGLVSKIVPREHFLRDVLSIANRLAALPSEVLSANKGLLSSNWRAQLHKANELELETFQKLEKGKAAKDASHVFASEQSARKAKLKVTGSNL